MLWARKLKDLCKLHNSTIPSFFIALAYLGKTVSLLWITYFVKLKKELLRCFTHLYKPRDLYELVRLPCTGTPILILKKLNEPLKKNQGV